MTSKNLLVGAALAGLVAGVSLAPTTAAAAGDKCYGVNKCSGTSACGGTNADGTTHACSGKNACAGQAWLSIDKDTCLKIKGGSLTPVEPAE